MHPLFVPLSATIPTSGSPARQDFEAKLHAQLYLLPILFNAIMNRVPRYFITAVEARPGHDDVYDIHFGAPRRTRQETPFIAANVSDELAWAALSRRWCMSSLFILWDVMDKFREANPLIYRVSWVRINPRPPFTLFSTREATDRHFAHDCFRILTSYGFYIIDLTGGQFGIPGWLYREKDYHHSFMAARSGFERQDVHRYVNIINSSTNYQALVDLVLLKAVVNRVFHTWEVEQKKDDLAWELGEEQDMDAYQALGSEVQREVERMGREMTLRCWW